MLHHILWILFPCSIVKHALWVLLKLVDESKIFIIRSHISRRSMLLNEIDQFLVICGWMVSCLWGNDFIWFNLDRGWRVVSRGYLLDLSTWAPLSVCCESHWIAIWHALSFYEFRILDAIAPNVIVGQRGILGGILLSIRINTLITWHTH